MIALRTASVSARRIAGAGVALSRRQVPRLGPNLLESEPGIQQAVRPTISPYNLAHF